MKRFAFFLLLISNHCICQVKTGNSYPAHKTVVSKPQHDPPEVVNIYTEVLAYNTCNNQITVSNDSGYFVGDTVLLIQMKGALIDTSNTAAFGTILDYRNAGNYEFNYISQKAGNVITFKNNLTKSYDIPDGVVQLVRVPSYKAGNFNGGLTCDPWDGTKGGILAIFSRQSLQSGEDIDVSEKGFRGGEGFNSIYSSATCNQNNFIYPFASQFAGFKGESIASFSPNYQKGKGCFAGGGGGGNSHNAGGGGGGNGGSGGLGGYQTDSCGAVPFNNRGIGGNGLQYAATANKIFLGSGGGAGHIDNASYPTSGGAGGGIAIVVTPNLIIYDNKIIANGANGTYCYNADCNDGMGGGGAAGTILLSVNQVTTPDGIAVLAQGGDGGNIISTILPGGRSGPGGGGGGGVFYFNGNSLPSNIAYLSNGGRNGTIVMDASNPHGAAKGNDGLIFFNLALPVDTVAFVHNIDSVSIAESVINCDSVSLKGLGYTKNSSIVFWKWYFDDGSTANSQNASHIYTTSGTYKVKLIGTDINGCTDSSATTVNVSVTTADAGADQSFCADKAVSTTLAGSGSAGRFSWTPASYLNNSTIQNPIATINTSTKFYFKVTGNTGCTATDSVQVIIKSPPVILATKSNDINCTSPATNLIATGGVQYSWAPTIGLNNSQVSAPIANPRVTTTYVVTGFGSNGCTNTDTVTVVVSRNGGLELPNSFTPNNDGKNDCFGIKYPAGIQNLSMIIYNYLGQKVFETNNPFACWDGTFKGKRADMGNYVYFLKANTTCGPVEIYGNLILIR
jgi:gliding motility-associated-like protein